MNRPTPSVRRAVHVALIDATEPLSRADLNAVAGIGSEYLTADAVEELKRLGYAGTRDGKAFITDPGRAHDPRGKGGGD